MLAMGRIFYGLLFILIIPLLLITWAYHVQKQIELSPTIPAYYGYWAIGAALFVMGIGMQSLRSFGQGLPMNAFPPKKFVEKGIYGYLSHPIYVGFTALCFGISIVLQSSSGFFVVSPIVALGCIALLWGYENPATLKRFPYLRFYPLVGFVPADTSYPSFKNKIRYWLHLNIWSILVLILTSASTLDLAQCFIEIVLFSGFTLLITLGSQTYEQLVKNGLRIITILFWIAVMKLAGTAYLTYHPIWQVCLLFIVILSSFFTPKLLLYVRKWGEKLGNSCQSWLLGSFIRVFNHGFSVGFATLVGVLITHGLTGNRFVLELTISVIFGMVGAAIWGQAIEGALKVKRPFGYYGSLIGGMVGLYVTKLSVNDLIFLLSALSISLSFSQAIGRVRCLINGCCHGHVTWPGLGIIVNNPHSRAVRISKLQGVPIHLTQAYSSFWLVLVGSFLSYLWSQSIPMTFIIGLYLILSGLGRFVEEAFRGEIQTPTKGGLKLYQWLALLTIVVGMIITCISSPRTPLLHHFEISFSACVHGLLLGLLGLFLYGVDFPHSQKRFSQL
jgi:protein-S-isoprenylcysteine O-methyltransferase Ste14